MSEERRLEVEMEVPGTPEQVWEAIATGPGITAWFMPAEVEGRVGGSVVHRHLPDVASPGVVRVYEPPRRFAYEEELPSGEEGDAAPAIATEFQVEARGGGVCLVRVVMSGFGEDEAWDRAIESFRGGWRQALLSLRLYQTHFAGEHAASVTTGAPAEGTVDTVWAGLTAALGLPADPRVGDRVAATASGTPPFAGTVQQMTDGILTVLLDEPAPGLGLLAAGGPGDEVYIFLRQQLFGPGAGEVASRQQDVWQQWLAAHTAS